MFVQDKAIRRELLVQEYISLRNESLAAKQNQQSVLQWSLGSVGVIAAATAAVLASAPDTGTMHVSVILLAAGAYGLAIPLLIACAFGVWIGEVQRMERAGRFLHSRERAVNAEVAAHTTPGDRPGEYSIMWETIISDAHFRKRYGKNLLGSLSSSGLFVCVYLGSLVSSALVVTMSSRASLALGDLLGLWLTCLVVLAAFFIACFATVLVKMFLQSRSDTA